MDQTVGKEALMNSEFLEWLAEETVRMGAPLSGAAAAKQLCSVALRF